MIFQQFRHPFGLRFRRSVNRIKIMCYFQPPAELAQLCLVRARNDVHRKGFWKVFEKGSSVANQQVFTAEFIEHNLRKTVRQFLQSFVAQRFTPNFFVEISELHVARKSAVFPVIVEQLLYLFFWKISEYQ